MKGVRDALTRLDGVQTVNIDLQKNRVTIKPDPGREFELSTIPKAINEAGFKPEDMWIRATGTAIRVNGSLRFRIKNWEKLYPLSMKSPPKGIFNLEASVQFRKDPPVLRQGPSTRTSTSSFN